MGEWSYSRRRPRTHQKDAGWPKGTSRYGGLPPSSGHSCNSVPPWEIKFCSQIPWGKFCEDKKLTHLFENVLNWDDSAGKESFDNAKARYWAEINGLHCDIPFPNPDMYIDVVDQDAFLDPRLVEDLYKPPPLPPPTHKEFPDYNSIKIIPTGWDVEDPATSGAQIPIFITAGGDQSPTELSRCGHAQNPVLDSDGTAIVPTGWGDEEDFGSSSARKLSMMYSNDASCGIAKESSWDHRQYWNGTKYGNWRNGRGMTRRFDSKPWPVTDKGEYYRVKDNSRGFRGRRKNYTDEYYYWHPSAFRDNDQR
ncbi:uncharacterized protein LOC110031329 [Phalaenopsis equestris]|uniref:uncharacterized protein LOC110031329 n=1 Tax=Phalaenopsis equestris TaxID=78828 RepID=UPI0009E48751|nr:uncharacterized protein LOC110031329 [Phalaenopsis equestris]